MESSSGAASAAATRPAITSVLAGSSSIPPTTWSISWSRSRSLVATPKLPPPPRSAQKRSACVSSSTSRSSPSAVTTSAASRSSIVSPFLRTRKPMPPPRVIPPRPTLAGVAEPGREAVFGGRRGVVAGRDPGLGPRRPAVGVDLDRVHPGEVEDDPALGRAVPGPAVAAASHRELGARLPRQHDDAGDVGCVAGAHDRRGPAVEAGEDDAARVVVPGVVRADHVAVQAGAEVGDLGFSCGVQDVLLGSIFRVCPREQRRESRCLLKAELGLERQCRRSRIGFGFDSMKTAATAAPASARPIST